MHRLAMVTRVMLWTPGAATRGKATTFSLAAAGVNDGGSQHTRATWQAAPAFPLKSLPGSIEGLTSQKGLSGFWVHLSTTAGVAWMTAQRSITGGD
jgi:hypothetical protein